MRRILFDSLMRRPLTEAAPVKDEAMLAELGASVERAARRRLQHGERRRVKHRGALDQIVSVVPEQGKGNAP